MCRHLTLGSDNALPKLKVFIKQALAIITTFDIRLLYKQLKVQVHRSLAEFTIWIVYLVIIHLYRDNWLKHQIKAISRQPILTSSLPYLCLFYMTRSTAIGVDSWRREAHINLTKTVLLDLKWKKIDATAWYCNKHR